MKKTIQTLGTILVASSLLIACENGSNTSPEQSTPVAEAGGKTVNSGTMKVGYVNTDSLTTEYDLIKDVQDEIVAEQMRLEGEYQVLVQALQKDYMDAQQGSAGLSEEALAILQQKLAQKEQEVMQQKARMENELIQLEQERTTAYLDRVQTFIADYAKKEGYDMIYGFNGLNNLLYIDKGYDLTRPIVDALNAEYQAEKESASVE